MENQTDEPCLRLTVFEIIGRDMLAIICCRLYIELDRISLCLDISLLAAAKDSIGEVNDYRTLPLTAFLAATKYEWIGELFSRSGED